MRVTEDSPNTLRHSVCKAAVGAEQACTAEFSGLGLGGARVVEPSRRAGAGAGRGHGLKFFMARQGGGQPRARRNKLVAN